MNSVLWFEDESPYEYEEPRLSRQLRRWTAALRDEGWDVVLVTLRRTWSLHEEFFKEGRAAFSLGCGTYLRLPAAVLTLSGIVRSVRPDIVHATSAPCGLVCGLSRVFARETMRVYHRAHTTGSGRLRLGSRIAGKLNDFTLVWSDAAATHARVDDGTPTDRIFVTTNGVDEMRSVSESELRDLRCRLGLPADAPVVVMVARMRPEKGHFVLLDAMTQLAQRVDAQPHLVLVGSGPLSPDIEQVAAASNGFVTHVMGHQDDLAPFYDLADAVAIPSLAEAFGQVAAEALSRGAAIVASEVGGLPEVLGDAGLLVPPGDASQLADGLLKVLKDEGLRFELGSRGRARYRERFTIEARAKGVAAVYSEILRRSETNTHRPAGDCRSLP